MKRISAVLMIAVLLFGLLTMPVTYGAASVTVWDEQFMTPYPYMAGQAVSVGYNDNQSVDDIGKWYRPGSGCNVQYTTLEDGYPDFSAGYQSSGVGNVQKMEFTSTNGTNGIAYRIPTIYAANTETSTVEMGLYLPTLPASGTLRCRVAVTDSAVFSFNNASLGGNTADDTPNGGTILYADSSRTDNTPSTWKQSNVKWSVGWHKLKFVFAKSKAGTESFDRVSYYYDGQTVAENVDITPQASLPYAPWIRHSIGAAGTYYIDYIKAEADGISYAGELSAPNQPVWDGTTLTWSDSQTDVAAYDVTIYKAGDFVKTYRVASDVYRLDCRAQIETDNTAQWTATVRGVGTKKNEKLVADSPESDASAVWALDIPAPAQPDGLVWDGHTLRWNAAEGATSYKVQLFKDSEALSWGEAETAETTYSFRNWMVTGGDGNYTAVVSGINLAGEGTTSESSEPVAFRLEDYRRTAWVSDFERPLEAGGNLHNTAGVVTTIRPQGYITGWAHNQDMDVSGQYLEIQNKTANSYVDYFPIAYDNHFDAEALSVKFKLYFNSVGNIADVFLSNGNLVRLRFDKGTMKYAVNAAQSFADLATYEAGRWYEVEVRLFKEEPDSAKGYTRAEYYLNGQKLQTGSETMNGKTVAKFDRLRFQNNGVDTAYAYFVDEICISDYREETLTAAAAPAELIVTDGLVSFRPAAEDHALAYAVKLYDETGKLQSTATKLAADAVDGVITHDFSALLPTDKIYTIGVTAKGDYNTYRNAPEVTEKTTNLGYGRYLLAEPEITGTVAAGETVAVSSAVTRKTAGAFLPCVLAVAAYDGEKMVDIAICSLAEEGFAAAGAVQTLTGSVTFPSNVQTPTLKVFRWKDLVNLSPLEKAMTR